MKFLFFACLLDENKGFGGAERSIVNLANWIADNTDNSVILESVVGNGGAYKISKNVIFHGHPTLCSSSVSLRYKMMIHYKIARNVVSAIKNVKPDVVVGFWVHTLFYAIPWIIGRNVKVIYSLRNDPNSSNYGFISKVMRWLVVRYADGIVFQTNQAKKFFSKKVQVKAIVIPNPTYIKKGEFQIPPIRTNRIVNVGRLELQKNQKMLIKAFAKVKKNYPDMYLEIYGDGSLKEELQIFINELGLNESVFLMGSYKDIFYRINDAKLFVLSSDFEGMPNALIEAMSLGIPSISTDCPCGGPDMLIQNGSNGYLVPVGDVDALAEKIISFLSIETFLQEEISKKSMMVLDSLEYGKIMKKWYQYICFGKFI